METVCTFSIGFVLHFRHQISSALRWLYWCQMRIDYKSHNFSIICLRSGFFSMTSGRMMILSTTYNFRRMRSANWNSQSFINYWIGWAKTGFEWRNKILMIVCCCQKNLISTNRWPIDQLSFQCDTHTVQCYPISLKK